jgi:hypothetical protein
VADLLGDQFDRYMRQAPDLARDQERRNRAPHGPTLVEQGLDTFADREKRIAGLIRDLDQMMVWDTGMLRPNEYSADPTVQALLRDGDRAVGALLECARGDKRLTRTVGDVGFDDIFQDIWGSEIVPVSRVAQECASAILRLRRDQELSSLDDLDAFVAKYGDLRGPDRWYAVLADDGATPALWLWAAVQITQRPAEAGEAVGLPITVGGGGPGSDEYALVGEPLRGKRLPSVSRLMVERAGEIEAMVAAEDNARTRRTATELAMRLARWDKEAAVGVLQRRCEDTLDAMNAADRWRSGSLSDLSSRFSRLILARVRCGDDSALPEYARWLRTPRGIGAHQNGPKGPMLSYPDHPDIAEAARWLFNDPESGWTPEKYSRWDWVYCAMLGVEGFREYMLGRLADESPIGSGKVDERGRLRCALREAPAREGYTPDCPPGYGMPARLAPEPGQELTLRVCDLTAHQLRDIAGLPTFCLHWPAEERDAAITECARVLSQYGHCFKRSFELPRLEQPATAADVAAGRAIFSLRDEGPTRLYGLPRAPVGALWFTEGYFVRPDDWADGESSGPNFEPAPGIWGYVWQAEEVFVDGRWQRFYGFAGDGLHRVPAEKLEFRQSMRDSPARSGSFAIELTLADWGDVDVPLYHIGDPVIALLRIRNLRGTDEEARQEWYRAARSGGPALPMGYEFATAYWELPLPVHSIPDVVPHRHSRGCPDQGGSAD